MLATLLIAGLAAAAPSSALVAGEPLPPLRGEFLSGRKAVLPDAAGGRVALVAVGFSYESRHAVEAWVARFRRDFGADSAVTFFEVPVIGGMGRLARPFIDGGMRRGTPPQLREHVITVYGGSAGWKSRLGFRGPDDAYLVLLDRAGRVAWRHAGPFREEDYLPLAAGTRRQLTP
jgi:hypothetical protein